MHPYLPPLACGVTCMLIETDDGLALVDTGFGLEDLRHPTRSMRIFTGLMRLSRDPQQTAIRQVQRLGYAPEDVRHILMTHLHLDHAGGLPDLPWAQVHVYRPEYEHVMSGKAGWEYQRQHWAHGPRWLPYELRGEHWYGLDAVQVAGLEPEIWLVPLTGHTPGHSAVAVRCADGWLLHGGDAVPFNMAVDDVPDWISRRVIGPHVPRMRQFMREHPEVQVIGAHMTLEFYAGR